MGKKCILNVNGIIKLGCEINYEDLKIIFQDFVDKNGYFPTQLEWVLSNNLPQPRIVNRILKDNHVTYNEFCNYFGKVKHVRTESKDYNLFLQKYKDKCNEIGRALTIKELVNNTYGLPSAKWFVDNCPNKDIKMYDDFILWCGFESNKIKRSRDEIAQELIMLQDKLSREITMNDIKSDNVSFSAIVLTRIFGGLDKAKRELGLIRINKVADRDKTFEDLKQDLETILLSIKNIEGRNQIVLKDISQTTYINNPSNANRYKTQFKNHNEDFYKFIESYGIKVATNGNGICFRFKDGELTKSFLEHKLSQYLRNELQLVYNENYFRDVKYSTFVKTDRRIDCDYMINYNGKQYYIEISGMIKPSYKEKWRETDFKSKGKNEYKDNMILKEQLLKDNNCSYFIWFSDDINKEVYRKIFKQKEE